jgi:hypothetical protein
MKMATFLSTKDGLYGSAISGIHVTFISMTVYCSPELVTNTLPVTYSSYLILMFRLTYLHGYVTYSHTLYPHVQTNLPTHFL